MISSKIETNPIVSFFTQIPFLTDNPKDLAIFRSLSTLSDLSGLKLSSPAALLLSRSSLFDSGTNVSEIQTIFDLPKTNVKERLLAIKKELRKLNGARVAELERFEEVFTDYFKKNESKILSEIEMINRKVLLIDDLFGTSSKGFDLLSSNTTISQSTELLESLQEIIKTNPDLTRLAKLLGQESKAAEKTTAFDEVEALGYSEIAGYTLSDTLQQAQASELALLKHQETRKIFIKKLVQKSLHTKEFVSFVSGHHESEGDTGPLVLCVDTSGSMLGHPELIAKALTLVVSKACRESGRPIYLINFSHEVQCLDLSNYETTFDSLLDFLTFSFHGGTDLRKALDKSLEVLEQPHFKRARVCVVSDFRIPKIFIKRNAEINKILQGARAKLSAVIISSVRPHDDLHIFDQIWHYELDPNGQSVGISASQWKEKHL